MSEIQDLTTAQGLLDAFLVENQELETLNARLSAFNLFNVLRVEKTEIRHSNVLAWLLSPDGSHGLGPVFLRRFLSRLLLNSDATGISLNPSQVELMSFADVEVLREWQNIDVLVRSATNKWCLLIENKIKSRESNGQLERYFDRVKTDRPDYQIIPVYLTLEGDDPSEDGLKVGYLPLGYTQVLELAEQIICQHRNRMPDDAQVFTDHYLETLRRLTMQDQELIDLCKTIYRKHREAIDLIVEYGAVSNVNDACIETIESLVECEFIQPKGSSSVWFLPKKLGTLATSQQMSGWSFLPRSVPIMFWYYYRKETGRMVLFLEVGPIADSEKRILLLKAIQENGLAIRDTGFRDDAKYTRIISVREYLKKDDEGEPDLSDESINATTTSLWKKQQEDYEKVLNALKLFSWD